MYIFVMKILDKKDIVRNIYIYIRSLILLKWLPLHFNLLIRCFYITSLKTSMQHLLPLPSIIVMVSKLANAYFQINWIFMMKELQLLPQGNYFLWKRKYCFKHICNLFSGNTKKKDNLMQRPWEKSSSYRRDILYFA